MRIIIRVPVAANVVFRLLVVDNVPRSVVRVLPNKSVFVIAAMSHFRKRTDNWTGVAHKLGGPVWGSGNREKFT